MKIVYAGTRFNSYDPQGGHTFEFQNFLKTFQAMPGVEVFEHPFDRILEVGKDKYNEELFELLSCAKKHNNDLRAKILQFFTLEEKVTIYYSLKVMFYFGVTSAETFQRQFYK